MTGDRNMKNYFDLKGQVAIVTGCSTGLGVQMAKALANQGANIVAVARRENLIQEVAAEIAKEFGVETLAVRCDITETANVDAITVYSGLADSASAFFGGGPVEAIISGTAAAPHPLLAGLLLVAIVSAIFLTKTITRIAKYIPAETISGFLFVLGAFAVFPQDAAAALSEDPIVGGCVIIVTSFSDPFIGMVSGIALKYLLLFLGGM